jgi:hypothetical protein
MKIYAINERIILKALYKKTALKPAFREIKPNAIAPTPPPISLVVKHVVFPPPLLSGGKSLNYMQIVMCF